LQSSGRFFVAERVASGYRDVGQAFQPDSDVDSNDMVVSSHHAGRAARFGEVPRPASFAAGALAAALAIEIRRSFRRPPTTTPSVRLESLTYFE
jgi:hypothetical protein